MSSVIDRDVGVPEHLLNELRMLACHEEYCSARIPKVVQEAVGLYLAWLVHHFNKGIIGISAYKSPVNSSYGATAFVKMTFESLCGVLTWRPCTLLASSGIKIAKKSVNNCCQS